jgi:hypothetical protein
VIKSSLALAGCVLLLLVASLKAQVFQSPKDWPAALRLAPKLNVGLDSKRSFISNRDVKTLGLKASLDFDNRLRLGFGVYFLQSPFYRSLSVTDYFGVEDTVRAKLDFVFMTSFVEYVFLSTKRWELSSPLALGIGDVVFRDVGMRPQPVLTSELGLQGSYKVFPWIGLGGGVGYRQILSGGKLIRENFNSPTYSFGLKFWFGYLYQKYFKK